MIVHKICFCSLSTLLVNKWKKNHSHSTLLFLLIFFAFQLLSHCRSGRRPSMWPLHSTLQLHYVAAVHQHGLPSNLLSSQTVNHYLQSCWVMYDGQEWHVTNYIYACNLLCHKTVSQTCFKHLDRHMNTFSRELMLSSVSYHYCWLKEHEDKPQNRLYFRCAISPTDPEWLWFQREHSWNKRQSLKCCC